MKVKYKSKGHGSEPPDSTNESAVFSSPCCKGNQENGMTKPTIVPITYTACHSKAFWLDVLSTARCKDTHSRFTPSRKVFDMQITACHMWLLSPLWLTACLVLNIWRSPNCVPTDLRGFSCFCWICHYKTHKTKKNKAGTICDGRNLLEHWKWWIGPSKSRPQPCRANLGWVGK